MYDTHFHVSGEFQATRLGVCLYQVIKARLINRDFTFIQAIDLVFVNINSKNIVTDLCQVGARDQTHIPGSINSNFHMINDSQIVYVFR